MNTTTQKATALGIEPSFGFGDRLGLATPGHLKALNTAGGPIRGIFAQQSIREMSRTNRNPTQVMAAAAEVLGGAGFTQPWGADADHLKTQADVDYMADAGFVFFTIDPSGDVDQKADNYSESQINAMFVADDAPWYDSYANQTISLTNGPTLIFDPLTLRRAAVKYAKAIKHAISLAEYIKQAADKRGQDHEIEISVDETDQPTTLAEHYIIADQLVKAGIKLVSLAPRFIGELEKGVDYKGDLSALAESMTDHNAVAEHIGPYKLSLHSGSDKLSMYGLFAKATRGRFHVKTAGTSYLEALRVVAKHDEALFREIIDFSRARYETDKATYHVSATLESAVPQQDIVDAEALEGVYLEHWATVPAGKGFTEPGRQILHCTFGSVLTDAELGPKVMAVLNGNPQTYEGVLAEHFTRHLEALRSGWH